MLLIIVAWFYIAAIVYVYGTICTRLLCLVLKVTGDDVLPPYFTLLAGLTCITAILSYISLLLKIDLLVHFILLGIGVVYLLIDYRYFFRSIKAVIEKAKRMDIYVYALFVIIVAVMAHICTYGPTHYDTGLYHAQMIRWIKEYPVVPGLGNLHARLAFNSSWFLTHALFDIFYFKFRSFHLLNGFILLLGFAAALSGLNGLRRGRFHFRNIARFVSLFATIPLVLHAASVSTDILPAIASFAVLFASLESFEGDKKKSYLITVFAVLAISTFAITIKLSSGPILLFSIYLLYRSCKSYRSERKNIVLAAIAVVFLILTPWMIRNIILSGYVVFPFPGLDIFNFDWKVPLSHVIDTKAWIESWARIPRRSPQEVLGYGLMHWVAIWFKRVQADDIFLLLEVSLVCWGLYFVVCFKSALKILSKYLMLHILFVIGISFWFVKAPEPRFGYSFLAPFSVLLITSIVAGIGKFEFFRNKAGLFGALLPLVVIVSLILLTPIKWYNRGPSFLSLSNYPSVYLKRNTIHPGQMVYSPVKGDQCWNSPLPCANRFNPALETRGKDLGDGFRASNPSNR